jgi:hypothetical protein
MELKFRLNLDELETKENILSVEKVVAIFHVAYRRAPGDFRVEVIEDENGSFVGSTNYAFWGPDQGQPYKSEHAKDSIDGALHDALEGVIQFDNNAYPDDVIFWEADDGTLYDGTGKKVSLSEAYKRRDDYRVSAEAPNKRGGVTVPVRAAGDNAEVARHQIQVLSKNFFDLFDLAVNFPGSVSHQISFFTQSFGTSSPLGCGKITDLSGIIEDGNAKAPGTEFPFVGVREVEPKVRYGFIPDTQVYFVSRGVFGKRQGAFHRHLSCKTVPG